MLIELFTLPDLALEVIAYLQLHNITVLAFTSNVITKSLAKWQIATKLIYNESCITACLREASIDLVNDIALTKWTRLNKLATVNADYCSMAYPDDLLFTTTNGDDLFIRLPSLSTYKGYQRPTSVYSHHRDLTLPTLATTAGNLPLLEYFVANNFPIGRDCFYAAIRSGVIPLLDYLQPLNFRKMRDCVRVSDFCDEAVKYHQLEVLKWLRKHDYVWYDYTWELAVKSGNEEIKNWMRDEMVKMLDGTPNK